MNTYNLYWHKIWGLQYGVYLGNEWRNRWRVIKLIIPLILSQSLTKPFLALKGFSEPDFLPTAPSTVLL
jgi:hypothetical protein